MITRVLPLATPLPWCSPVHARTCCETLREGGDKKTKTRKTGRRERERDVGGLREGKDPWVWEKEKQCHAKAAVLGRFSKKKQDRK